jgi:proteasome accessory factor B
MVAGRHAAGGGDDRAGAKRDRLARLLRVVRILEAHREGIRPSALAIQVGVSRRTAYRDLVALETEVGIPVWSDKGLWGLDERALLPRLSLTLSEGMLVYLSARLLAGYADTYDPELAAALLKLADILPPTIRGHVERTVDILARRPAAPAMDRTFRALTRAWAEARVVEIEYDAAAYDPARPPRTVRVHPWLIEPSTQTHALYLIGWDEDREAPRTYKMDRIRHVTLTPDRFDPPETGAAEERLEHAWGIVADQGDVEVAVRFDRSVAARVLEAVWHPSQRVEKGPDGSITWRVTVPGTLEVRLWILQWGDDAEVLAPSELRADVARTLRAAADRYTGPA